LTFVEKLSEGQEEIRGVSRTPWPATGDTDTAPQLPTGSPKHPPTTHLLVDLGDARFLSKGKSSKVLPF
jgi:hypothetical protein